MHTSFFTVQDCHSSFKLLPYQLVIFQQNTVMLLTGNLQFMVIHVECTGMRSSPIGVKHTCMPS